MQILRFFRNILVNFFPLDIGDESLAEVVHSLFNLDAHLYTMALLSGSSKALATSGGTQLLNQILAAASSQYIPEVNQVLHIYLSNF